MALNNKKAAQALAAGLTGEGLGEKEDFLTTENHLFINKLNYICKNYDTNFKDVSNNQLLSSWDSQLSFSLSQIGENFETHDGRASFAPDWKAAFGRERNCQQSRLLAVESIDDRKAFACDDPRDTWVLLRQEDVKLHGYPRHQRWIQGEAIREA